MFSFLKSNPVKKLRKAYYSKLEDAMHAQREGNIERYSYLTKEANEILCRIKSCKGGL